MAFQRILCPVDFSDCSRRALDTAIELAARLGASLLLVHVVDPQGQPFGAPAGALPIDPLEVSRPAAPDELLAWCRDARAAGVTTTTEVLAGAPAAAVVDAVRVGGHDLVVLGSHGRGGLGRALLGSVADHVVRRAGCPVLVVPLASQG